MTHYLRIIFEPTGRRIDMPAGETLLAAAQAAGIGLIAVCDGRGTCHQCSIRLIKGELNPPTGMERQALSSLKLESGFRLACQAVPGTDATIEIPLESTSTNQRLQLESVKVDIKPDPVVDIVDLVVEPSSRSDTTSDQERMLRSLVAGYPSAYLPRPVKDQLLNLWNGKERRVRLALHESGRVVGILARGQGLFGLAVDIGTTKLAAYLVDLTTGHTVTKSGMPNPQVVYGEDVISRIAHANLGKTETTRLQMVLVDAINSLVMEICRNGHIERHQIVDAVAVGNTAMHHLFVGLPTRQLGETPFIPARRDAFDLPVDTLSLDLAPGAVIHLPPLIAGFVGADHVAADLACGLSGPGENTLLIDIGTNTEITLRTPEGLTCCSCASGPAFEGAHIHAGMRASPGAIERVFHNVDGWRYLTIDGKPAAGICGSGILDAVAEMRQAGIINERGALQKDRVDVVKTAQGLAFLLSPADPVTKLDGILVTRRDVHEIQLAKAAIRSGIEILLMESGLRADELERIIVAGAFGTYLHLASALTIGMLPDLPEEKYLQVGNAAGAGARMMLVSRKARRDAEKLQECMRYVELTTRRDFQDVYLAALPVSARLSFPVV